jgi:hypothetical protein
MYLAVNASDKDPNDKVKQLFAYVMMRTAWETRAQYNLADAYSNLKSPSAITGLLDVFGNLAAYPMDIITDWFAGKTGKRINRGAYRGKTQFEQNLWKMTPMKNVIELNDLGSKRRYYETQIMD